MKRNLAVFKGIIFVLFLSTIFLSPCMMRTYAQQVSSAKNRVSGKEAEPMMPITI
jgi:hypothetical protein